MRLFLSPLVLLCCLIGNYKVQVFDPQTNGYAEYPGIGMHVEVRSPEDKVILSKLYTSEGKVAFTSNMPGEHSICLFSNSTKWFAGSELVKFHIRYTFSVFCICFLYSACSFRYPNWRTCSRLRTDCYKRKTQWAAAQDQAAVGSSGTNHKRAELSASKNVSLIFPKFWINFFFRSKATKFLKLFCQKLFIQNFSTEKNVFV